VFPSKKRFPRTLFPSALKAGRRFSSQHLSVVLPSVGEGYAVVVPKKITNLSVKRHQIKRRVLAALKTISLPTALIVFPKSSISSVGYQDVKIELVDLLSKIHS